MRIHENFVVFCFCSSKSWHKVNCSERFQKNKKKRNNWNESFIVWFAIQSIAAAAAAWIFDLKTVTMRQLARDYIEFTYTFVQRVRWLDKISVAVCCWALSLCAAQCLTWHKTCKQVVFFGCLYHFISICNQPSKYLWHLQSSANNWIISMSCERYVYVRVHQCKRNNNW